MSQRSISFQHFLRFAILFSTYSTSLAPQPPIIQQLEPSPFRAFTSQENHIPWLSIVCMVSLWQSSFIIVALRTPHTRPGPSSRTHQYPHPAEHHNPSLSNMRTPLRTAAILADHSDILHHHKSRKRNFVLIVTNWLF